MYLQALRLVAAMAVSGALLPAAADAALIQYELTSLGGNRWEYAYTVTNDTLGAPLEEFTIFFDVALYENLAVTASPAGWSSLVVEPDPLLPDDGFFDALGTAGGITPAGVVSGFRVAFDFLGVGAPDQQPYHVVDPITFAVPESGVTIAFVPESHAGWLLAVAALALGVARSRRAAAVALAALAFATTASAIGVTGQASVSGLQLVGTTRVSRTVFEYEYRITVANVGDELFGVVATVTSNSTATEIVNGNVDVGDIAAAASALSSDTFIIRHDRSVPFSPSVLAWQFDASGFTPSALRLNELRFSPLPGDAPFVELWNSGSRPLSLGTFRLRNEQGDVEALPSSVIIAPGGLALVLFDGQTGVSGGAIHVSDTGFLSSTSGGLVLVGPAGFSADRVAWGDQAASVTQNGGGLSIDPPQGVSLARAPEEAAPGHAAWTVMSPAQATPGVANPAPVVQVLLPFSGAVVPGPDLELSWYPLPGAASYRAQVASDASYTTLVSDRVVTSPVALVQAVAAGTYFWRVQRISSSGSASAFSDTSEITVEPGSVPLSASTALRLRAKASALAPAATSGAVLVAPLSQHKDTRLLLLESQREHGAHSWRVDHAVFDPSDPADNMNCAAASITMINRFFGGRISQDRVAYEVFRGRQAGPEQDLSYGGSGFSAAQVTAGLSFALGGPALQGSVTAAQQALFWQLVQQEIDAGRPLVLGAVEANGDGHATVLVAYRDLGGGDLRITHADPWAPGSSAGVLTQLRLSAFIAGYAQVLFWTVPALRQPFSDEPEIALDSDNDGVVDFDETRRFGTDPSDPDTDSDFVGDLTDIRASVFDSQFGYSLGGNDSRVDIDGDGAQMELDADSDDDKCTDGQEDFSLNGDFEPALGESHNFVIDKRCRSWVGTTRYVERYKQFPFTRIDATGRLEWTPSFPPGPAPTNFVSLEAEGDIVSVSLQANGCRATLTPNSSPGASGYMDIDYTVAPAVATGQAGGGFITTLTDCAGNTVPGWPIGALLFEGSVPLNGAQDQIRGTWRNPTSDPAVEVIVEMNYNLK
jgi:hypothetical protein